MTFEIMVVTYETKEMEYINKYSFCVNDSEELKNFIYGLENKEIFSTSFIYNKENDTTENIAMTKHAFTYLPQRNWLDYKPQIIEEEKTEIDYITLCNHIFKAMTYKCNSFKEYEDTDFSLILFGTKYEFKNDNSILYDDNDELIQDAVDEYESIYAMRRDAENLTNELENMEDKLSDIFEDILNIYPFSYTLDNTLTDIQKMRIVTQTLYNKLDNTLKYHYHYEV